MRRIGLYAIVFFCLLFVFSYADAGPTLVVSIDPLGAIEAGAQWRVDGGPWHDSGYAETTLSEGPHTVEFKDIGGEWTKPNNRTVTLIDSRTALVWGSYASMFGSLQVTIDPPEAIGAGAKWRRMGTETWRDSGTTESGIPEGDYAVEFNSVPNWGKPDNLPVTITKDVTTSATGTYVADKGSLTVTISPQGAIDGGAKWRVDGGDWHDSGYTQTGLFVGQHTVEFGDATGWTRADNLLVVIVKDQTTTATGTYKPPSGSLCVTINPKEAADAGAKWRRVGTATWLSSGATETGIPVGPYTVEFGAAPGWTPPDNLPVTIVKDQTANTSGTYIPHPGSLQVLITPQEAINAGAQWRVDGGAWQLSGYTQNGLSMGQHTVEFNEAPGWRKPDNLTVNVLPDQTTHANGTYSPPSGDLCVTIAPQGAIDAGAKWQVDGGAWHNSGETQTRLLVGMHTVAFNTPPGWTKPLNRTVSISNGNTTTLTGTYTAQSGSLRVTIAPQGAIDGGAQWRVDGGSWHSSGYTEASLSVGSHTVEFIVVPNWTNPGNQSVTINNGQTATLTGTYAQQSGSLSVAISPQGAIDAGAKWRVDGGTWHTSGYIQTGLSMGQHAVTFNDVSNLTKPADLPVMINDSHTVNASGTYTPTLLSGSLRVTISPQGAIDAGAKWRRVGTLPWLMSGATEAGIPVGLQTVEFSGVPGWTTAPNRSVTINNGRIATVTGMYTAQTGSLQVTISPQGAIDAGAKWRRAGTSTWRNSGTTEAGIPVGQYTVEFYTVGGWTTPDNQAVTITQGQTTNAGGTYGAPSGSLKVTISPQGAVDAGAKWRVDGGPWHGSGETQTGLSVGMHTVSFSIVTNWTKPGNRTVTIGNGQMTTLTGTYVLGP